MVAAAGLAAALAGCGDEEDSENVVTKDEGPARPASAAYSDEVGDVAREPRAELAPAERPLDLRRVELRREGGTLTLSFETAAPPVANMTLGFSAYEDNGVREDIIEVRFGADGSPTALVKPAAAGSREVEPTRAGTRTAVELPLTPFTSEERFRWRARVARTRPTTEIVDRFPNTPGDSPRFRAVADLSQPRLEP